VLFGHFERISLSARMLEKAIQLTDSDSLMTPIQVKSQQSSHTPSPRYKSQGEKLNNPNKYSASYV
jgi:hypothetical protein